jgi:hypothetical protein
MTRRAISAGSYSEGNSIRRGLYSKDKKPMPLVLVPLDGPDAGRLVGRCKLSL